MINKEEYLNSLEWVFEDNLIDYSIALSIMESRAEEVFLNKKPQLIWFLEHKDVYTAGISAKKEDLISKNNIPVIMVNRGGKHTFHGPKMQICYLIIDLKRFFLGKTPDISIFVKFLEEWVIEILKSFNIKGEIRQNRVGIWVVNKKNEEKIAAIGIKLKKWVSYHGVAINIAPDLNAFNNIIPCGIKDFGITSIEKIYQENLINFNYKKAQNKIINISKDKFEAIYRKL